MNPATRQTNRGAPARAEPRHVRRRRALRALSVVLLAAGTLLVVDAVLTVVWQEPVTAYLTKRTQHRLSGDFDRLRAAPPTRAEQAALTTLAGERRRTAFLASSLARKVRDGEAVARIRIPRIDASYIVVKGTAPADLRKGPGFYDGLPLPGRGRTVAIAGHRTTYLAPFRHIDELQRGDRITLTMPYATFTYAVEGHRIVDPSDTGVLRDIGRERLVLSACHPLFSAARRIVLFARLVETSADQFGAATLPRNGEGAGGIVRRPASTLKAGPPSGR